MESIKWDQKGVLLASSAQGETQLLVWSTKSKQAQVCINDTGSVIRDFRWSNLDLSQANASNVGLGFLVTVSMD